MATVQYLGDYIGGQFVKPENPDGVLDMKSPADLSEQVIEVPYKFSHVDRACEAAKAAFPEWSKLPIATRVAAVKKLQTVFEENKERIAEMISRETGKALWDSMSEATATIMSQSEVVQYWAVQNHDLAKEISAALGTRTVITHSINLGRTVEDNAGESRSETARPLLSPDEIRQLPREAQILFVQNNPPIMALRLPFWEVAPWQDWADRNPVEGDPPRRRPQFHLEYREQ